jgi:hypothetical protein
LRKACQLTIIESSVIRYPSYQAASSAGIELRIPHAGSPEGAAAPLFFDGCHYCSYVFLDRIPRRPSLQAGPARSRDRQIDTNPIEPTQFHKVFAAQLKSAASNE